MKLDRILESTHSCRNATTEDWKKLFGFCRLNVGYNETHIISSALPGFLKTYFSFSDAHFSEYSVACCVVQFLCQVQFRLFAENTFLPFAKQILNLSQKLFCSVSCYLSVCIYLMLSRYVNIFFYEKSFRWKWVVGGEERNRLR